MNLERAHQVNDLVVAAWMAREGLSATMPDLSGISLAEALEAHDVILAENRVPMPGGGSRTLRCVVEPTRLPALFSWALAQLEVRHAG